MEVAKKHEYKFTITVDGDINYDIQLMIKGDAISFEAIQCVSQWKTLITLDKAGTIHKILTFNENIEDLFSNFVELFEENQVSLSIEDTLLYLQFSQTHLKKQIKFRVSLLKTEINVQQVIEQLSYSLQVANNRIKTLEQKMLKLEKLFTPIMKESEEQMVYEWVSYGRTVSHLDIVYKGSIHGFQASVYHDRCDGKENLLCFIESSNRRRFGGYIFPKFQKNLGNYVAQNDNKCFIFSLDNKIKYTSNQPNCPYAYHSASNYGFTMGGGYDLCLSNDCRNNNNSQSNLSQSYGKNEGGNSYSLAGSSPFQVYEIEIYEVKFLS